MGLVAWLGGLVLLRVHRTSRQSGTFALFIAVALLGVSAALPLQLEDEWLTVAWAVEAALLARLAGPLRHPLFRWGSVLLGVAVAVRLIANPWALSYGDAAGWPVLNWTLYTWGIPAVALLLSARWLRALPMDNQRWQDRLLAPMAQMLVLLSVLVGFAMVNVQVSHFFQNTGPIELSGTGLLQGMVRSLSWALYGMALLITGFASQSRVMRFIGFAFVLLAAGKVCVVDLWALSGFVRVGSVLGLGACLLAAAFLFERLVLREDDEPSPQPAPTPTPAD
jgi:uncharacterized membrane protein